jgi:hypothetical protein
VELFHCLACSPCSAVPLLSVIPMFSCSIACRIPPVQLFRCYPRSSCSAVPLFAVFLLFGRCSEVYIYGCAECKYICHFECCLSMSRHRNAMKGRTFISCNITIVLHLGNRASSQF